MQEPSREYSRLNYIQPYSGSSRIQDSRKRLCQILDLGSADNFTLGRDSKFNLRSPNMAKPPHLPTSKSRAIYQPQSHTPSTNHQASNHPLVKRRLKTKYNWKKKPLTQGMKRSTTLLIRITARRVKKMKPDSTFKHTNCIVICWMII